MSWWFWCELSLNRIRMNSSSVNEQPGRWYSGLATRGNDNRWSNLSFLWFFFRLCIFNSMSMYELHEIFMKIQVTVMVWWFKVVFCCHWNIRCDSSIGKSSSGCGGFVQLYFVLIFWFVLVSPNFLYNFCTISIY